MSEFHCFQGKVYILENEDAKRVKVGMTTNNVEDRCIEVNQMWLGTKATCQICGTRIKVERINHQRFIPQHIISGLTCTGSNSFPLEKDSSLAKAHLEKMKSDHKNFLASKMASNTRKISKLEERIKKFETMQRPVGVWKVNTVYYTNSAENVELKSHALLSRYLDKNMPIGEIFSCSAVDARAAIESALSEQGLLGSSKKEIVNQ